MQTGQAQTTTETLRADEPKVEQSTYWLKRAGEAARPPGYEYLGSAVVHYYKGTFEERTFTTICQALVSKIEEGFADVGWKNLRKELMRKFGREEKNVKR